MEAAVVDTMNMVACEKQVGEEGAALLLRAGPAPGVVADSSTE